MQFNQRRRRKRRCRIYNRVILAVLVFCIAIYSGINAYSYYNNEAKKEVVGENELPTDKGGIEDKVEVETDDKVEKEDKGETGNKEAISNKEETVDKGDTLDNSDTLEKNDTSNSEEIVDSTTSKDENKTEITESNDKEQMVDNELDDKVNPDESLSNNKGDESYFDDAVFIGDSRTEGLKLYSGLKNATFYAEKGLDVNTIFTSKIKIDGNDMTIIDALNKQSFGKVYIMLGVNELGWPYDKVFIEHYEKVIDAIREAQPTAKIYVQSIIHISKEKDKNPPDYFKNETIVNRNKLLKEMAKEKEIHYLDLNKALTDKNGYLYEDASVDGVHLNKTYCLIWKDYLIKHIAN